MASSSSSSSSLDDTQQDTDTRRLTTTKPKSKRPQLSCLKCRQRKVKCDRILPCTACSMNKSAEECVYDMSDSERQPIMQAEALRKQEKEIQHLKAELERYKSQAMSMNSGHLFIGRQDRFPTILPMCSGMPRQVGGTLESDLIAQEFADLAIRAKTFSDFVDFDNVGNHLQSVNCHPFPTIWPSSLGVSALLSLLPSSDAERNTYLDAFENKAVGLAFPYLPYPCSRQGISDFLSQAEFNSNNQPDALALVLATFGQGLFYGAFDRCINDWSPGPMSQDIRKADMFMAAAFQALRSSAFTSKPTPRTIEALTMILQYLCDSGRFIDAWSVLGLTTRLAFWMKYHRYSTSTPDVQAASDATRRASLWWWLMYIDSQFSTISGRPLAISKAGDCLPADVTGTGNAFVGSLSLKPHITNASRAVLEQNQLEQASIPRITERFLDLSTKNPLCSVMETRTRDIDMSHLPWSGVVQDVSHYMHAHSIIVLVNQRHRAFAAAGTAADMESTRGYMRILESCRSILRAFNFMAVHLRTALASWMNCQAAFCATMILIRGMAETSQSQDITLIRQTREVFVQIHNINLNGLAESAAVQIDDLCQRAETGMPMLGKVMSQHGFDMIEGPGLQDSSLSYCEVPMDNVDDKKAVTAKDSPGLNGTPLSHQEKHMATCKVSGLSSGTSRKSATRRVARRDKDQTRTRKSSDWSSNPLQPRNHATRPWAVSKKQQRNNSPSIAQTQTKAESCTVSASKPKQNMLSSGQMADQQTYYLPSDMLSAFPDPPSLAQSQQQHDLWNETETVAAETSDTDHAQMQLSSLGSLHGLKDHVEGRQQQMPEDTAGVMQLADSGVMGVVDQSQRQQRQHRLQVQQSRINLASQRQGTAAVTAQHVFAPSNGGIFAQPQSPALWGHQFNPMLEQRYVSTAGQPAAQQESYQQQQQQQQQSMLQHALFSDDMSDPTCLWPDEGGYWGG